MVGEWAEGWLRVKVTAAECGRIPAQFLEEERQALGERAFRREYCCEFLEDENAMFPEWLLEKAMGEDLRR